MASSENNHHQDDSESRRRAARNRKIEPPRKAPETERSLTHSPYFNGPLYQRMSEDLHLGDIDSERMMVHVGTRSDRLSTSRALRRAGRRTQLNFEFPLSGTALVAGVSLQFHAQTPVASAIPLTK